MQPGERASAQKLQDASVTWFEGEGEAAIAELPMLQCSGMGFNLQFLEIGIPRITGHAVADDLPGC